MSRILGLDLETTGFDPQKNRITELGVALGEPNTPYPLDAWGRYVHAGQQEPLTQEIKDLTGITDETLQEFGIHPTTVFQELESYCVDRRVDYLCGHNCDNFDKPFLLAELDKYGVLAPTLRSLPWIDTRKDIPFKKPPVSRKLQHLLSDLHRAHNLIAHRAMFDAAATLWLLSQYDFETVLAYHKIPWKVVRVLVSFQDKDLAKAQGYSWQEINHKIYDKCWVKLVKENELDAEVRKFPQHEVRVIE